MKIPIKFRGVDADTGKYVYGQYSFDGRREYIVDRLKDDGWRIKPDSVAQLLGYDANGEEVYEGDILEFDFEDLQKRGKMIHYEYKAHMKGFATTADGCYIPREKFSERTLKK